MATPVWDTLTLENGLIIPASAVSGTPVAGKTPFVDAAGNVSLQVPSHYDSVQSGVIGSVASTGITAAINSSTRVLTFSQFPTNDIILFKAGLTALIRATMPTTTPTITAMAASKFAYVAVDAVPPTVYGQPCTYVISQSADQASAVAAANAFTTPSAGNVRIWDGIAATSAGSAYSLTTAVATAAINSIPVATGRDRRPWANGFNGRAASITAVSTTSSTFAAVDATHLQVRAELAANNTIAIGVYFAQLVSPVAGSVFGILLDGAQFVLLGENASAVSQGAFGRWESGGAIAAGSHLIAAGWASNTNTQTTSFTAALGAQIHVREQVCAGANQLNGTA